MISFVLPLIKNKMKKYKITGWHRWSDNEKDFEVKTIEARNSIDALTKFKELFIDYNFFSILVN